MLASPAFVQERANTVVDETLAADETPVLLAYAALWSLPESVRTMQEGGEVLILLPESKPNSISSDPETALSQLAAAPLINVQEQCGWRISFPKGGKRNVSPVTPQDIRPDSYGLIDNKTNTGSAVNYARQILGPVARKIDQRFIMGQGPQASSRQGAQT